MCLRPGRPFSDDERADAPWRCSFIPTAEINLTLLHERACQNSGSVNSKPLPHLKEIRKDGTSLQLDNKMKGEDNRECLKKEIHSLHFPCT